MFSPDASIQSARSSLRNPRRRPRNSDGPQQQQPRRKRSKLGDESFISVSDAQTNGNGSAVMNGHPGNGSVESSIVLVDMPVREKKTQAKRPLKDDTALYLNKNDNYSVKKLPSFPSTLSGGSTPFRASALPSDSLALALTTDHALVWDYHGAAASTKVLTLPLPPTLKGSDPLPLGAIVRNGPTNDFGLVAIAPSTGRIVFWENVDSAEARSHFPQRHQGVDGSVKLYSGERITDLVDIEHAGYILVFSSGRLAQLTLRDSQGRPSITTTILSAPNGSGGSFFSLKGLLGGAIRKTIASVKARPSDSKGQMEVITGTKSGLFQLWDLSWSGQQIFKRDIDVRSNVLATIQEGTAPESRGQQDVHILDFVIMDQQQAQGIVSLLTLVALSGRNMLDYFLLELDLSDTTGTVSRAIPLRNFHQTELPKELVGTLLLPSPGHTAFVQFQGAVVVASLAEPEESPEAQLFSDSGSSILPFQDTIYFREDAHVRLVGHAQEHTGRKDKYSSAVIFVQDYGILQFVARPPPKTDDDDSRRKVTPYSKLLQATFFSTVPGTILDFSTKSRYAFGQDEIEKAAISISAAVLSSSFENFEKVTSSMDDQLRKRAFALRTLNSHLRSEYGPISFSGKWQLLWHAEKLAAAQQLWKWYQAKLQDQELHPEAYPEKVLMSDIIRSLNEKYKTPLDLEKGETDHIRQFFLKDIDSIDILIPWGWNHLRIFYLNTPTKDRSSVMQRLSEGNDVFLVTLEAGFSFRQANIERYGLEPESLEDGVLKPGHGYDTLNHFWSSSHNIVTSMRSLVDVGRSLAEESFEQGVHEDLAQKIGKDNPRLVRICCQVHIERFQWALEQADEKKRETGRTLREEWDKNVRPAHIYGLMDIGLATDGMNLAEKYRDMQTLVNLIWDETAWLEVSKANSQSKIEQAEISVKLNRIKERIARYFQEYGHEWAGAYYMKHVTENQSGQLFEQDPQNQHFLTHFLRTDPSRARLSWINEICGEKKYEAAAVTLYNAAKKQETNAWCSKVELSIAKLALLCKDEKKPDTPEQATEEPEDTKTRARSQKANKVKDGAYRDINNRLDYAKIQDLVYERLLLTITGALDDESAVQLLMDQFGQGRLTKLGALQSLLRQGFDDLVHHRLVDPCLLIDVLTLMTYDETVEATDIVQSNEFAFALKTLFLNWDNIQRTTRTGLVGLIWKRLMLKDNWEHFNNAKDISDAALQDSLAHTHTGWTFKQLLKMYSDDPNYKRVWPPKFQDLWGNGCTDGELCIRFPSEDLRRPIMSDNAQDEAEFKRLVDEERLEEWFVAACRAAQWSLEKEKHQGEAGPIESDDPAMVLGSEQISESVEVPASEAFEGDDEDSVADVDVKMEDI